MKIFRTWMIILNSTCFPCGGGLFMFCAKLKMMNGNICHVARSRHYFMIPFHLVNAHNCLKFVVAIMS
jgi:hypothetical protein